MAAYSWGLLAGVHTHGVLPLFYPVFLTILLVHRAHRDEQKCLAKYGAYYEKYMAMVPYEIYNPSPNPNPNPSSNPEHIPNPNPNPNPNQVPYKIVPFLY